MNHLKRDSHFFGKIIIKDVTNFLEIKVIMKRCLILKLSLTFLLSSSIQGQLSLFSTLSLKEKVRVNGPLIRKTHISKSFVSKTRFIFYFIIWIVVKH